MLTDAKAKNAKPGEKLYRIPDGRGLCLEVAPEGGKRWRFRYRADGKQKMISLGTYPDVTLKAARNRLQEARRLLSEGIDPSAARQAGKVAQGKDSFEALAREWFARFSTAWVESHAQGVLRRLEQDVFPFVGSRPIQELGAPEVLAVLRRIEARGVLETARRTRQICGQVFRYAVATGRAERDPTGDLKGALAPPKEKHHAAITDPKAIGGLLRALDDYSGSFVVRQALRLAPLVFVRPGELRQAEWAEINLDAAEWRIPAEKMKMRDPHIVPLSRQALEILRSLQPLTGRGRYVFPGGRSTARPMSDNAVTAALRRMGFEKGEMTGHGFRAMASTVLNEQGWPTDVIERQLAHAERNRVRAAYNRAEHLAERTRMMQAWADYLDGLKNGADVVPLRRKARNE